MTTDTKPDGIRKAAILVSALSPAAAGQLLDQMPPWQADEVRRLQKTLGPIDAEERRTVIEEFFKLSPEGGKRGQSPFSGTLFPRAWRSTNPWPARSLGAMRKTCQEVLPTLRVRNARHAERDEYKSPPFRFLQQAEDDKLVKILASERPQTIALVLAHLPPEQAGAVLVCFTPAVQVEIVRRLVDLEETHPEILREVGHALEVRLSEQVRMQRRRVAGLAAVEGILEASGSEVSAQIFENLSTLDHSLADKLGPQRLEFLRTGVPGRADPGHGLHRGRP